MAAAALRRTSSLTGTDSHPESLSWPSVAGRDVMATTLPPPRGKQAAAETARGRAPAGRTDAAAIGSLRRWTSAALAGHRGHRRAAQGLPRPRPRRRRTGPPLPVPGHWRSQPELRRPPTGRSSTGAVSRPRRLPGRDRRYWLQLDGVFYDGDVWLDGSYLGDTEGYFFPHTFEVTEAVLRRRDHLLAVEVACTPPADRRAKRNLTGVFQHCRLPRRRLESRWDLAARPAPRHAARCGSAGSGALPEATAGAGDHRPAGRARRQAGRHRRPS